MSAATEDYFSEQNVFAHWLDQNCRVEPANIYLFSTAREIYQNWKAFAEANGEHAGSSKGLGARLARIPNRHRFYEDAAKVVQRRMVPNFKKSFERAVRTARR